VQPQAIKPPIHIKKIGNSHQAQETLLIPFSLRSTQSTQVQAGGCFSLYLYQLLRSSGTSPSLPLRSYQAKQLLSELYPQITSNGRCYGGVVCVATGNASLYMLRFAFRDNFRAAAGWGLPHRGN